jgi:hypothetical protein
MRQRPKRFSEDSVAIVANIVLPSTSDMSSAERISVTRRMLEDLDVLSYHDGCIAASWALEFIRKVTE